MVYGIALGSNLGNRLENLRSAVSLLLACVPGARVIASAPVYETDPVDCPEASLAFYNSVIEIEASAAPLLLLDHLLAIEESLGRARHHEWHAPRTVDLDVLYAGDLILTDARLALPHPRMAQRCFVLLPLSQIRPEWTPPGQTKPVRALLEDIETLENTTRLVAEHWLRD